jgi:hypothetical protein
MQELRPMLGRSPRSLTRYVNIFRLLKAVNMHDRSADNADQQAAERDPDEVTMFLLAVLTGYPDVAQQLLSELARPRAKDDTEDDSLTAVVQRVRAQVHGPADGETESKTPAKATPSTEIEPEKATRVESRHSAPREDQWDLLEQWLAGHEGWASAQRVGPWAGKAQRVARYSFRFDAIAPVRVEAGSPAP